MTIQALPPKRVLEIFNKMKTARANFETTWQECAEYMLPRKDDVVVQRSPGARKGYAQLLDSTAMTEAELLAGALHGMLYNPAGYFFGLSTGNLELDQNDNVRLYLQDCVRIMHNTLNATNFQTETAEMLLDEVVFGMSPVSMEEDDELDVVFSTRPVKEVYVRENRKGKIDTLYRSFKYTARDIVDEWGEDALKGEAFKKVRDAYKNDKTDEFEIVHALYPRKKGERGTHKFISQYILVSEKADISVKGYLEFPWYIPRWAKASGEHYGRGLGEKALPEAKMLNKMAETTMRGAQKVVDPPLQIPDDGFMIGLNINPGGFNYYRSGTNDRIEAILNDARIDFGFQSIQMKQAQIRNVFYSDQLKLREGPQMTALEVSERVEQAFRLMGPVFGRQSIEGLQPMVERLFGILTRRGKLPEPPAELEDVELKVQYTSLMAISQRQSEMQGIQRTMQNIAPFASADPSTLDVFNGRKMARYIAQLNNFPQEGIRTKDELDGLDQQRQQLQQKQQQAMQDQMQADTDSKTLSAVSKFQPKAG